MDSSSLLVYKEEKMLQWSLRYASWVHADSSVTEIIVLFNCSHVPEWVDAFFSFHSEEYQYYLPTRKSPNY